MTQAPHEPDRKSVSSLEKKAEAPTVNLLKLAKGRKFSELEAAWMAALERPAVEWEQLFEVSEYLTRSNEIEQAVLLLWALVASAREKLPPAEALALAKRCALIVPNDGSLKGELAELYAHAHSTIPEISILVKNSGLHGGTPAGLAIERMERFLTMRPGRYVRDKNTGRIGRVEKVEAEGFILNVGGATAVYDPGATDALETLEPDDLRALALFEHDRIASLRENDPAELVRLALKTFGGRLEFRQLKERMTAGAVPSSAWSSWWTKAREAVKRSPFIEMTDQAQPYLVMRRTALSYEERVRRHFQAAAAHDEKFEVVLDYLRNTQSGQPAEKAVTEHLVEGLQQIALAERDTAPVVALGALALLGEFRRRFADLPFTPRVGIDAVLAKISDFLRIPAEVKNEDVQLLILAVIKDNFRDRWPDIYAKLLPGCSVKLCDVMARELMVGERDLSLSTAITAIVQRPEAHPDAFIWLWRAACVEKPPKPFEHLHHVTLTIALLNLGDWGANLNRAGEPFDKLKALSMVEGREKARALITQVRHAIAANDYRIIRGVIERANTEEARHLLDVLNRNRFFSDYARNDIIGIISSTHRHIFAEVKKPWEEDIVYTTSAGLERRQKDLEKIVNVDLPKIAEAIGRAIGFGDVSDNAEYRYALEQRDSLSKRATLMRQEIAKAHLITREMVNGDEVTIGATVKAKNTATGEIESFTFLGPWDTDIPKRIYSYQAPLSQAFMGKRMGETVTAPGEGGPRTFEILEIAPAI